MSCCYRKDVFKQTNKNPVDNFLTDQESEFHSTVLFVSVILNYNHPHSRSTDSHCNEVCHSASFTLFSLRIVGAKLYSVEVVLKQMHHKLQEDALSERLPFWDFKTHFFVQKKENRNFLKIPKMYTHTLYIIEHKSITFPVQTVSNLLVLTEMLQSRC